MWETYSGSPRGCKSSDHKSLTSVSEKSLVIAIVRVCIALVVPIDRGKPAEPLVISAWFGDRK